MSERHREVVIPGELMAMDLSAPYEFSWSGNGAAGCVQIPFPELGLPVDVIRGATGNLRASPLNQLFTDHVNHLVSDADRLSADSGAAALGAATIELARAAHLGRAPRPALRRGPAPDAAHPGARLRAQAPHRTHPPPGDAQRLPALPVQDLRPGGLQSRTVNHQRTAPRRPRGPHPAEQPGPHHRDDRPPVGSATRPTSPGVSAWRTASPPANGDTPERHRTLVTESDHRASLRRRRRDDGSAPGALDRRRPSCSGHDMARSRGPAAYSPEPR